MTVPAIAPANPQSLLNRQTRERTKDTLATVEVVDVLVIGGGVTGCGVALDAASRGLSVALVEAHDLAFGTSRWSSKMVHGGLRYLAKGDIGVAWESATERALISQYIAPHLVHPFVQVIPFQRGDDFATRAATRAGLQAGDVLRRASRLPTRYLPAPRMINPDVAFQLVPGLPQGRIESAMTGWDCRLEDDARFVTALARTAAAHGAHILTHARATELTQDGARVRDELDGSVLEIAARNVINATGVWAGTIDPDVAITASRGTHLVVRSERLGMPVGALTYPVPGHFGRFVFAIPQFNGLTYIGLTDEPAPGPIPDVPTAPEGDIDWILDVINLGLQRQLERADVVGTYAGLRPLVTSPDADLDAPTADVSRRHLVRGGAGRLITVTGGKLTTYRRMAQDAVDLVTDRTCVTPRLPVVGFGASSSDAPRRLRRRFGSESGALMRLADGDASLLAPLAAGAVPILGVEVLWSVLAEGAMTYEDVVERRLRISMVPSDEAAAREEIEQLIDRAAGRLPG